MSIVDPTIFRTYDIRGIYPKQLNKSTAYLIGQAVVVFVKQRFSAEQKINVVIGRDCRLSSRQLLIALGKGIVDQGGQVIDIGLVSTDLLYFAQHYLRATAGIMITASHLAKQFNGFKILIKHNQFLSAQFGLPQIKRLILKNNFSLAIKKGKITKRSLQTIYLKHTLRLAKQFFPIHKIDKRKVNARIVIDTGNGMSGPLIKKIIPWLPVKITLLFSRLDGRFPNHLPDPSVSKNLRFLRQRVLFERAILGVAFDADADRVVFVDEEGIKISNDLIIACLSELFLNKYPRQTIVYNLTCSRYLKEFIKHCGGRPAISRTGHTFIKQKMLAKRAIFGGEISGHFYYRDNAYAENAYLTLCLFLEVLIRSGKTASQFIAQYKKYYRLGEINFKVKDRDLILQRVSRRYKAGKINHLDGLTVNFSDWWFNLRPSHTEPLLRLVVEAITPKLAEQKLAEISKIIKKKKI